LPRSRKTRDGHAHVAIYDALLTGLSGDGEQAALEHRALAELIEALAAAEKATR
jgi:hypothetical protein